MDGRFNVGLDHIRSLAITCLALDGLFDALFNSETICGYSSRISDSYDRLFSVSLLNLAISVRVSLSGEPEYKTENSGVTACGAFENGAPNKDGGFSIKDVCDKIIHATKISKPIERGVVGACYKLSGHYQGKPWDFDLGVRLFCELMLKWLEDIEARLA